MRKFGKSLEVVKTSATAAALLSLPGAPVSVSQLDTGSSAAIQAQPGKMPEGKFFCNSLALTPAQRAHHKRLTDKLLATRSDTVPTEKGYEFQYDPNIVSLAELTDWVSAESKCCPFFDFHIDLEYAGRLLCLRITGEAGVKAFIAAEFHLPVK